MKKTHPLKSSMDVIDLRQRHKIKSMVETNDKIIKKSLKIKRGPFKKAVVFKKTKKPSNLFYFPIAGIRYAFDNPKLFKKIYDKMEEGDSLDFKHEHKNPNDACAIAVYFNKTKIGYVPKEFNFELLKLSSANKSFLVLIHKLPDFDEMMDYSKTPEVVVVVS